MENDAGLNNLEELEGILRNLFLENKIDENKYYSGLISLALSHAMLDQRDEVTELISKLSTKFTSEELPDLLKNNSILQSKAKLVANYLNYGVSEEDAEDTQIDLLLAGMDKSIVN